MAKRGLHKFLGVLHKLTYPMISKNKFRFTTETQYKYNLNLVWVNKFNDYSPWTIAPRTIALHEIPPMKITPGTFAPKTIAPE